MTTHIIEPLTRVEGRGRILLEQEHGRLVSVQVDLNESPRLFEGLLLGRSWQEVPELTCRICGICSTVHKLAALHAIEGLIDIDIPMSARHIRELALLGGHIQSHALHLFCLVLPDFCGEPSVLELVRSRHPLALAGLELKALGNQLQELCGGRMVHPVNLMFGGVGKLPGKHQLAALEQQIADWCMRWPTLADNFSAAASYPDSGPAIGTCLATGDATKLALKGETLWTADGTQRPLADYALLLQEQPVAATNAKWSTGSQGPFLVGALARRKLLAQRSDKRLTALPERGIYSNNTAQLQEISWALGQAQALVRDLLNNEEASCRVNVEKPRSGVGMAAFEAPRGLLIHCYTLDDSGQVIAADIVTPTAINQHVMAEQIFSDLAGEENATRMVAVAEQIARAYDPCISCAVHLLEAAPRKQAPS